MDWKRDWNRNWNRRGFLAATGAAALSVLAPQRASAADAAPPDGTSGGGSAVEAASASLVADGPDAIPLWPSGAPGGPGPRGPERELRGSLTAISRPRLLVWRPARPNGAAVLLASGGGYAHLERRKESAAAAAWLQSLGVTACELIYRLPAEGWSNAPLAPFQDAQRGLRLLRSGLAGSFTHIGVLGFSAGGHLAGMLAAQPQAGWYAPQDGADSLSARPDALALLYPVISMLPPLDTTHASRILLAADPGGARRWSVELQVDHAMPPTFLAHALDDPIAAPQHASRLMQALRAAGVPAELHQFGSGGHGWGMGKPGTPPAAWPALLQDWAARQGWCQAASMVPASR
ncbi:alpha/beta hydrolase [Oxalobacteraceae bacterium A2-2]